MQRIRFWLNGKEIEVPVTSLVATLKTPNADFQVVYGLGPSGYDDITWREIGGGGVVDTLFTIIDRQLYIGVLLQNRPYQSDKPILNAVRGYLDPEKTRFESANAEVVEEAGIGLTAFELPGDPANPNNASVETWGGGITHYKMWVNPDLLEAKEDGFVFKPGTLKSTAPIGDKILSSHFIPWKQAAYLACQMTGMGLVRLLAHLDDIGAVVIKFDDHYTE
jgi:hypothetical protein